MKNFFKKNNYKIIKNAISSELANFCYEYFLVKRKVAKTMIESTFLSPYIEYFGK